MESNNGNYINSQEDFEKWIRMATDNVTNSWDLALIDYFYDLSLLRDGDGINFQKASATLDGCVKIYSSRVDSAVTETGRLINGLATSKRNQAQDGNGEDEEEEVELDPNAPVKERRSRVNVANKNTIVDFDVIKFKKNDLELYVDPLFKKALTDFDEGGSKSLLLNMLNISDEGRIMFDTTDSAQGKAIKDDPNDQTLPEASDQPEKDTQQDNILDELEDDDEEEAGDQSMMDIDKSFAEMDIDQDDDVQDVNEDKKQEMLELEVMNLGKKYLGNFHESLICPSINELEGVLSQKVTSAELMAGLENAKLIEESDDEDDGDIGDYVDFDFGGANDFDDPGSFQNDSKLPANKTSVFFEDFDDEADDYGLTMRELFNESKDYGVTHIGEEEQDFNRTVANIPDENLLAYFDQYQRKNWAGPEHWKVQRIKNAYKPTFKSPLSNENNDDQDQESSTTKQKKKTKEHVTIDFLSDDFPDESEIFLEGSAGQNQLPMDKRDAGEAKHQLPEDHHFSTRNFIYLFTKEKLITSAFNKVTNLDQPIDTTLYADNITLNLDNQPENVNDANFYNDHGPDIDFDFDDANDDDEGNAITQSQELIGSQLLAKSQGKQSPLSYSRVAKRVDIILLKDNIWDSLQKERASRESIRLTNVPELSNSSTDTSTSSEPEENLKFTEIIHGLNGKYEPEAKKDLSTSVCFIALLHLANENGFTITNTEDNTDLMINRLI
ncbi:Condensin complex subunit 2 [Wickerhamomyces ciferrii]|uniref:Condensin complex subunit 2 n=1 Tax=Wickerhamomyces ciferrii (strain ATCC 14091 / BCRC 22168 / CBS 111 / JCM 3599 / NBRC 0793 / NRRL Y-1031 F-60-10) TaxID=1206466 RepID=K0KLJ8_WICCF|nr:Condensin complex subunit 2 [Wickerhamomyces ciferrii]CCH42229.1 Condensin complex subunit 2 [Wickerhamomyces ciferrii]